MDLPGIKFRFWLRAQWMKYIQGADYVPAEPILFIHIPKTAGTSFRNMLFRVIDHRVSFPNLEDLGANHGKYTDLIELPEKLSMPHRQVRFLTGHYPFAAGELLPAPRQYFVFLREPVARTISNLLHFQLKDPDCRDLDLWQIFQKHQLHLQNLQTRYLGVSSMEELSAFFNTQTGSEKLLDQALANLEKCTFVGITEDFATSVRIAEKLLGVKLGYELKRNVAPARLKNIDTDLVNRLQEYLVQDIALYRHALNLFEKQKSLILNNSCK